MYSFKESWRLRFLHIWHDKYVGLLTCQHESNGKLISHSEGECEILLSFQIVSNKQRQVYIRVLHMCRSCFHTITSWLVFASCFFLFQWKLCYPLMLWSGELIPRNMFVCSSHFTCCYSWFFPEQRLSCDWVSILSYIGE